MSKRLEISYESLANIQTFIAEEEAETDILTQMVNIFDEIKTILATDGISSDDVEDWNDISTKLAARAAYLSLYFGKIADMSDVKLVRFGEDENQS